MGWQAAAALSLRKQAAAALSLRKRMVPSARPAERREVKEEEDRVKEEQENARNAARVAATHTQDQEDQEEEAKEDRSTLRREGLPTSIMLCKKGDLFVSSPARLSNKLAKLFEVRLELCRNANLSDNAVLPISLQMQGQRWLATRGTSSIAGQKKQRLVISALHKRFANDCDYILVLCCVG